MVNSLVKSLSEAEQYVNTINPKLSCKVATNASGTLSSDFEAGDTIDDIVLSAGDRILIKDQDDGSENGIYVVNTTGLPTRSTDMDSSETCRPNSFVFIEEGTDNSDKMFQLTTDGDITIDTTSLTFAEYGSGDIEEVIAGSGLTGGGESGSVTLNVVGGDGIAVNADEIIVTPAQTTITSVKNTALEIGRDDDNQIKFSTDNQIIFEVGGGDNVIFKGSGEIEATSLDISGDADIDGTLEADAITIGGNYLSSVIQGTTVNNATTAAVATTVTITDNENTNEDNAIIFAAGGDVDGGNLGLESDGNLTYNPSTGKITAEGFIGDVTGNSDTATKIASITNSNIVQLTETQTLTNKTLTSAILNTSVSGTAILDEDDMSSNSATQLATQQSIKAYVDSQTTAQDLDFQGDTGGPQSIDLDSQTLTLEGGTGIDTTGSTNKISFAIDSTVATLTGSQVLTNKTLSGATLTNNPVLTDTSSGNNFILNLGANIQGSRTISLPQLTDNDTFVFEDHTQTLTNKTLTSAVLNTDVSGTAILDEDNMASNSATQLATQQSIKAYADTKQPLDAELTALAGLTSASNKIPMFNGSGTATTIDFKDEDDMTSNSATAVASQQSIKAYVDSVAQGLHIKTSCRVATTASGTLSSSFENGDTIDGVSLSTGDRILIKNQSDSTENGIYIVKASGAPDRSDDMPVDDTASGDFTFVTEGTVNGDHGFVCTSNSGSDTIGTHDLSFTQFSGAGQITAGDGLEKSGNTLSIDAKANSGIVIDTSELSLDLGASSITGTLAVSDGGTGSSSLDNLITLGDHTTGNYVASLVAGSLIDLQNNTGETSTPKIDVDLSEATEASIADGDYILFLDGGSTGTAAKESLSDLVGLLAGTGLTTTNSVLNVIGGDGITANTDDIAITAAQTTITSIKNSSLEIGRDNDNNIDFGTDNTIIFNASGSERVSITSSGINITGDITVSGSYNLSSGDIPNNAADTSGTAAIATNIDATANNSTDETVYLTFVDGATGTQGIETDTGLTYNPSTGKITATGFIGALTGDVTGDITGNAGTVTNGVYTTNNLSVFASTTSSQLKEVISDETGSGSLVFATSPTLVSPDLGTPSSGILTNCTGTASGLIAGTATNITATANNSTDETVYLTFVDGATGTQGIETDTGLTYNPSTGILTTTSVTGNLTGTVLTATQNTIDHDSLANFVSNEHIDHSSVSIIAGDGLTGGGTIAANRTLTVGAGTGIDVAADEISVDVSDFMTNGSNNRVLTATGTDAMNAEENLTFDGSVLNVNGGLTISGNIVPNTDITYDLGNASYRFRDLYLSGSTIRLGNTKISTNSDGDVQFMDKNDTTRRKLMVDELIIGSGDDKVTLRKDSSNKLEIKTRGSDDSISDNNIEITSGGTGATTESGARTNLGLEIGTDVQAYDAGLNSIASLTTAANKMIYTTGLDAYATTNLTSFARNLLDDIDASTARATLEAGTVTSVGGTGMKNGLTLSGTVTGSGNLTLGGTLAINNSDWSGTELSVGNGGTGQTTYSNGELLIGNSSNTLTKTTLTQGDNISITNGDGSITIAGNYSVGDNGLTEKNFTTDLKTKLDSITNNKIIDWTSSGAGTIHSTNYTNTMGSGFVLEDGDGTEVIITENKEVKFIDGNGININWIDASDGTDGDPYDLSFSLLENQTTITSIYNNSLKIGKATDQEYISFGTSDEVNTFVNNTERLSVTNSGVDITGNLAIVGTITGDTSLTLDTTTITTAELGVLDSVTAGTASASKALVLDTNKDIGTIRNLTIDGIFTDGNYTFDTNGNVSGLGTLGCGAITSSGNLAVTGTITGDTSLTLDSTTVTTSEIGVLNGVTAGTASASKALVLNASGNISGVGNISCGEVTMSKLILSDVTSGKILIGDGTSYEEVEMSGDATIDSNGTLTIANDSVTLAKMAGLERGKIIVGDPSGNPSSLTIGSANTVLKSNGSDASWGNVTTDMIANDSIGADQLASNAVVNDSIATNAAIDIDKINGNSCSNSLTTLEPGDILYVGDKTSSFEIKSISFGNLEDTIFGNISGDALISNDGTLTVSSSQTNIGSITNTSLKIGTATDQEYISFSTTDEVNTFVNNTERLSVTNSGVDITGNLAVTGTITGDTSLTLDSTTITTAEIGVLNGVTAGTAVALKALVLNASGNISGLGTFGCGAITSSGEIAASSLDISGDVDIDGTLEADAVTIQGETLSQFISDKINGRLSSISHLNLLSQTYQFLYGHRYYYIFAGVGTSGAQYGSNTERLEVDFTATSTHGYLEYGFLLNSSTSGEVALIGVSVGTGGTAFDAVSLGTTVTNQHSRDAGKIGLLSSSHNRFSLYELCDLDNHENFITTGKFVFENLTIGTRYKMGLYGRVYTSSTSGSSGDRLLINGGGHSSGNPTRNNHMPAFLKFVEYDSSIVV